MTSIVDSSVHIHTLAEPSPCPPPWFGEFVLVVTHLKKQGVFTKVCERVRFTRRRFGRYEIIDFLAVLFGYAISGERTLEEFYESLQPFAVPFMAVFDRDRLPARSTLSRFLAALTEEPVEALRTLFLDDLLARPLTHDQQTGGLVDRVGSSWIVFDVDGTREAARQRALPQTDELPPPFRRLDEVCAPGYTGRKRGETVRTRTTVSQAHSYQWLGSFGNRGNGRYREELRKALSAIGRYLATHQLPQERALLRLDGQYGNGAVLSDVAGFTFVTRGKDYHLLDHPLIQARLHLPPDQLQQRPESPMVRSLYDCPEIPVGPEGAPCRVVVATHPSLAKRRVQWASRGQGWSTNCSSRTCREPRFTACDVVELYLHRGAFEPTLADEDLEQDPDRWCSHSAWGQECWQLVSQWVWNLRLELGHQLEPTPLRITEFAPALPEPSTQAAARPVSSAPASGYSPPTTATSFKTGRFTGADFSLQPDGMLRCPAGQSLLAHERRRARRWQSACGLCSKHSQLPPLSITRTVSMEWQRNAQTAPGERAVASPQRRGRAAAASRDWSRRVHRRACMQLLRHQRVEVQREPDLTAHRDDSSLPLSRASRVHSRLSWAQRQARNARRPLSPPIKLHLFGMPNAFAAFLGLEEMGV